MARRRLTWFHDPFKVFVLIALLLIAGTLVWAGLVINYRYLLGEDCRARGGIPVSTYKQVVCLTPESIVQETIDPPVP